MTNDEIIEAISTLNAEIYDKTGLENLEFEACFNGTSCAVMFLGLRFWSEDDDGRECYADGRLEPLVDFLRRSATEQIGILSTVFRPTPTTPQG